MPTREHDIRELTDEDIFEVTGGAKGSDSKSFWSLLGTILGGPLIGTSIGTAIGHPAGDETSDA
jgi:uncharacterized membrane protein